MNRSSSSYRRLALYYCYVFVLNAKECSVSSQEVPEKHHHQQQQQQQQQQHEHRQQQEQQQQHRESAVNPEEWVVRLEGGPEVASLLALRSGYSHIGPVLGFKDTYLWRATNGLRYRKRGMVYAMNALSHRAKIVWADQQKAVMREKRDYLEVEEEEVLEPSSSDLYSIYDSSSHSSLDYSAATRSDLAFNDELWDQEWYLMDQEKNVESTMYNRLDLNVLPVYRLGITGRGVRVAVLDDGLEYTHEDLRVNYDPEISYDITDRDEDPVPRYEEPEMNRHGTRCAGEIAMEADNRKCGVGVAFEAKIGGIKMLDGVVNDRVEAEALGYRSDIVDIYTASWGPPDDGRSLEAPGRLASEALERGANEGRAGRGSIYVWASGNGGSKEDDCGCDGYVNNIYTIAIGSASQAGSFPWYGEICPAKIATTYSSGAHQERMIVTTDLKNTCTTKHTGTSASAPLAAGILALALQVNSNLTWRDVQHLIVFTSNPKPLSVDPGWDRNAVGLWFNPRFGFGLMDAFALVMASFNWTNVPEKTICEISSSPALVGSELSYGVPQSIKFESGGCAGTVNEIRYLEHVQIETNVEYSLRGALQIYLTAPSGSKVRILGTRKHDNSTEGFVKWKFTSLATWGENPVGTWTLDIIDEEGPENNTGKVGALKLILHGTKEQPVYLNEISHDYNTLFEDNNKLNDIVREKNNLAEMLTENHENRSNFDEIIKKDWLLRFLFQAN